MVSERKIKQLIELASQDDDVVSVLLFGSTARNEQSVNSDVDVCVVLKMGNYTKLFLSEKKLKYLSLSGNIDVQIYQQLPIYIRQRILKEGKILFCKNEDELYEIAFDTIQKYEDFKHIYDYYLNEIKNDR
ncbi:MAG: hypothetical protein IGBAC_0867 [Ignavibacteriae bacterium]|nr:MAG: hypothetical protein IGBAC_0867 [Ignavibacteriota bacterium]